MLFITYQSQDYKEFKNPRYKSIKKLLGIPEEKNIYWCTKANNLQQAVLNSFCISPNQPFYMVMFETDDYYEVDAIKWNYDVDNGVLDINSNHLQIEHDHNIEYIVTDIPEKRIEIPVPIVNLLQNATNDNKKSKEEKEFYCYLAGILSNNYGNFSEISSSYLKECEQTDFYCKMDIPKELIELKKYYILFIGFMLPSVYVAGRVCLLGDIMYQCPFNMRPWQDILQLNNRSPKDGQNTSIENFYSRMKNYQKLIYKQLFLPFKEQYPNEPCSCGSGKKYKKCCANFDEKLDSILRE